jgi:hypothetical protein
MNGFLNPIIKISNFFVNNGNLNQFKILSNNPINLILENLDFKNLITNGNFLNIPNLGIGTFINLTF